MSRGAFHLHFVGLRGNAMVQYLFARAFAERHDLTLHTDPWFGETLFDLSHPRINRELPRKDETSLKDDDVDVSYRSYSQQQKCVTYTRAQARQWLQFRPYYVERLLAAIPADNYLLAHRRVGDYPSLGYVSINEASYLRACEKFWLPVGRLQFVTEENPCRSPDFAGEFSWAPDFFRLSNAANLLRGNSSFSFVAGLLCQGRVFCPNIDGVTGGPERDVPFEEGNHCRFAHFDFVSDLHVPEA